MFTVKFTTTITRSDDEGTHSFADYNAQYDNLSYEAMHALQSAVIGTLTSLGDSQAAEK